MDHKDSPFRIPILEEVRTSFDEFSSASDILVGSPLHQDYPVPAKRGWTVFTKTGCLYCQKAKVVLAGERAPVTFHNCDGYLEKSKIAFLLFVDGLAEPFTPRTFPMVFLDGAYVGGCDGIEEQIRMRIPVSEFRLRELRGELPPEPLLKETEDRFVLFPIDPRYQDFWEMYQKSVASFWTAQEVCLGSDKQCWKTQLNDNERFFISKVLSFFAASDGIVNENLLMNFANEVQSSEARCFYGFQIAIENIHSEMYSLLLDTYIDDTREKNALLQGLQTDPSIRKKAQFCWRYTDRDKASFAERVIAFAACEGIFFSGSFCAVFWLKKRGLMNGLAFSNELISRDEGLHCDFACMLYKKLINPLPVERVHQIISDSVEIEKEFISESLPVSLIGMNAGMMCEYIEFCADRLLHSLGVPKIWNTPCPFDWMNLISLQGKTNFFEKRVGEYSKAGVGVASEDQMFSLDCDF